MSTAQEKLEQLRKLEANWDGYGSPSISPKAIYVARELLTNLANPAIGPMCGGGLQVEIRIAGVDIEIEIDQNGKCSWLIESREVVETSGRPLFDEEDPENPTSGSASCENSAEDMEDAERKEGTR